MDWKKTGVWTGAVLTAILILLFSFKSVAIDEPYQISLVQSQLREMHSEVLSYILGVSDGLPAVFNERESSHLLEVRRLFYRIFTAIYVILALWFLVLLSLRDKQLVKKSLRLGSIISLSAVLTIFVFSLVSFTATFNAVHQPFFSNNSWVFPSNSLLMQLYPESFFQSIALRWGFIVLFSSVIIGLLQRCLNGSGGGGAGH